MKTIGRLLEEALDLSSRNLFENAFVLVCEALNLTAQKLCANGSLPEPVLQGFIHQNWRLISFLGIPPHESLPRELPFGVRRAVASFNSPAMLEELIVFVVKQTLAVRRLPFEIGLNTVAKFAVENDKLLLPQSLFFAFVGCVVLHPVNKNETVDDKYWIHLWDFKMFISELWGRADLAERIMKIYLKP